MNLAQMTNEREGLLSTSAIFRMCLDSVNEYSLSCWFPKRHPSSREDFKIHLKAIFNAAASMRRACAASCQVGSRRQTRRALNVTHVAVGGIFQRHPRLALDSERNKHVDLGRSLLGARFPRPRGHGRAVFRFAMRSAPVLTPWHHEMKDNIRTRVKEQVAGRTGASWEDRLQQQKAVKVQAMKMIEKEQKERIKAATEKGIEKQQVYSPLVALRSAPLLSAFVFADGKPDPRKLEVRKQEMSQKIRSYAVLRNRILEKMRTRDPLFKVEDVSAAKALLAEGRRKRQEELQNEEKKRWEHLEDCAAKGVQKREALFDLHNSPSFDERLSKRVEIKTAELKDLEKAQKERIRDAIEVGHSKSQQASPLLGCLRNPPDNAERQKEILEERQRHMALVAKEYIKKRDEMLHRQQTRTPLFSCDEVEDAQLQLEEAARKRKKEMKDEMLKQKQHINELQNKALARPLMMEAKYSIMA
eukprot:s775_g8.t1